MEFEYSAWDSKLAQAIQNLSNLMQIYQYLLNRMGGDPEEALEAMRQLQEDGVIGPGYDLEGFRKQLEENKLIQITPRGAKLSARGENKLRESAFEEIFQKMKIGGQGQHRVPRTGGADGDLLPEKRKFEFGDDMRAIDFQSSLFNSISRSGSFDLEVDERDLEVFESEKTTGCATVLLIDVSHSMVLYGEDRITPAKQVALAFTHLILTKYPKDDLSVVLFGDDATEVPISEIAYIQAGPYHTNTQMGLRLARNILLKKRQSNKQIFMITDGKPSMMKEPDGSYYRNTFGLDPKIVGRTLDEAVYCRKKNIPITTFMVTDDSYLQDFVKRLTELNQGRAFFSSVDNLGEFMMWNFVTNRKR